MDSNVQIFLSSHVGNCSYCHESKTLDSMIKNRQDYRYHCIDCEVNKYVDDWCNTAFLINKEIKIQTDKKITKIMQWIFG